MFKGIFIIFVFFIDKCIKKHKLSKFLIHETNSSASMNTVGFVWSLGKNMDLVLVDTSGATGMMLLKGLKSKQNH